MATWRRAAGASTRKNREKSGRMLLAWMVPAKHVCIKRERGGDAGGCIENGGEGTRFMRAGCRKPEKNPGQLLEKTGMYLVQPYLEGR